jgi:hypothetical protein
MVGGFGKGTTSLVPLTANRPLRNGLALIHLVAGVGRLSSALRVMFFIL